MITEKKEDDQAVEIDQPHVELVDKSIKSVVSELAKKAEQLMAAADVSPEQVKATMAVLQKLDALMQKENESLMQQSPFKKIEEVASKMTEANRKSLMDYINKIKADVYAKMEADSKKSQITEEAVSVDDLLRRKLESEIQPHEALYTNGGIRFESLDLLNDFLAQTLGVDLAIIKANTDIWKNGNGTLISKKAPGLKILIYDRTEMGQSDKKFAVEVNVQITAGGNVEMFKAALKEIVEERKPKEETE